MKKTFILYNDCFLPQYKYNYDLLNISVDSIPIVNNSTDIVCSKCKIVTCNCKIINNDIANLDSLKSIDLLTSVDSGTVLIDPPIINNNITSSIDNLNIPIVSNDFTIDSFIEKNLNSLKNS